MRRLLLTLALLACLAPAALAACGGGDEKSSGPLDAGLAHFPKDAPLAVAIDTDLDGDQHKALDSILGKFPLEATSVRELLRDPIGGSGSNVDFESDIEPLLGNPLVIGATDVSSLTGSSEAEDFVIALQTKDKAALDELIEKTGPQEIGEMAGATKYEDAGAVFAVEDDVVVIAPSEEELDQALERADGDDHLDTDTFEAGLDGLPGSGLARVYADLEALLASQPGGERARRDEWIRALRTLGLTATVRDEGVEVEFKLRTDSEGLNDEDLPIATGDESPPVIRRDGEIGFGIRDLAQIVRFAEAAGQAIDPSGFADYARAKQTLDARLDVSIDDDLIGQLTGDVSASVALDGGFGVRAELKDPAAFERTLAKIADVLPAFAQGAGLGAVTIEKPDAGEGLYALRQADGDTVVFGVLDGVLVVADSLERARELASEQPERVDGAEGAVALSSDAEELANVVIGEFGERFGVTGFEAFGAQLFTGPLEDLIGSMSASTDGLRGRVTLGIE
jgi:Protein of unknown function (DUF3352)